MQNCEIVEHFKRVFKPSLESDDLSNLPWISLEDKDAVYKARYFLPSNPFIVEAGACDAEDTLRFRQIWPDACIYAFEPVKSLYDKLINNTKGYNIECFNKAIGSVNGIITFFESASHPAASSIYPDNLKNIEVPETIKKEDIQTSYNDTVTNVGCIYLDSIDIPIDYLWLDTEGSELDILKSGEKKLNQISVINIELNFQEFRKGIPLFNEVHKWIIDHNFSLRYIWRAHKNWQANGIYIHE